MSEKLEPEASHSALLEKVGRPVIIVDSNGQIVSGNAEARNIGLAAGGNLGEEKSPRQVSEIHATWLELPTTRNSYQRECVVATDHGEVEFDVHVERWSSEYSVWCFYLDSPVEPEPKLKGRKALLARLESYLDETDAGAVVFAVALDSPDGLDDEVKLAALELAISRVRTIANGAFLAVTGANEIAVVHAHRNFIAHSATTAGMVRDALSHPYEINDKKISLNVGVGVAIGWPALSTAEALLRDAESARNSAREFGANHIEIFDDSLRGLQARRAELAETLTSALNTNNIELQYQTIVELPSEAPIFLEGHLHWMDREMGFIPQIDVLPVAERSDLIQALGRQVINIACRDLNEWRKSNSPLPLLWVNVSSHEILLPHFIEALQMQLSEHGVATSELGLDIPAAALMESPEDTSAVLVKLGDMGIALALDDIDEISINLELLSELKITALKLDRDLLWGIHSPEGAETLKAIVKRCYELDAVAIAKGVETPEQRQVLVQLGITHAQGLLFAQPQEVSQVDIASFSGEMKADATIV